MNILIVNQYGSIAGGVETYLQGLIPELSQRGHKIAFACAQDATDQDAPRVVTDRSSVPCWRTDEWREIQRWRPDLVYLNGLDSPDDEKRFATSFPTIYFAHNYHGLCISGTRCHSRVGYRTCTHSLGPGCLARYLPYGCGGKNPFTMWQLYATQRRKQENFEYHRHILVASRAMRNAHIEQGVAPDKVSVLPLFPPGTSPQPTAPTPRPFSDQLLWLGRLTQLKGVEYVPRCMEVAQSKLGRKLKLIIAGSGPASGWLERELKLRNINYQFTGWIDVATRNRWIEECDLLLFSSIWPEPLGLAGMEGACFGLPAVAFRVGGVEEWLEHERTGLFATPPNSADSLGLAIANVMSNHNQWIEMRHNAWKKSFTFSKVEHVDKLLATLSQIVSLKLAN